MEPVIRVVNSQGQAVRITRKVRECAYKLSNMREDSINFARVMGTYSGSPVDYEYSDTDNVMGGLSYREVLEAIYKPLRVQY